MDEILLQHTLVSDEEEMDVLDDEEDVRAVAATLVKLQDEAPKYRSCCVHMHFRRRHSVILGRIG